MSISGSPLLKKYLVIAIVPCFLVAMFCFFYVVKKEAALIRDNSIYPGWNVEVLGEKYSDVNLLDFSLPPMLKRGDSILLSKVMEDNPKAMGIDIEAYFMAVRVSLEDNLLYEYGFDNISKGGFVGYGIHFIELGTNVGGKTLTIEYSPGEDERSVSLPELIYAPANHLYATYFGEKCSQIFLGLFSFFVGWLFLFIATYGLNKNPKYIVLIMTAVASIIGGIWLTSSVGGLEIFSKDITTNSRLEYAFFMIIPIPILFLSLLMKKNLKSWEKKLLISCVILSSLLMVVFYILHSFDVMHLCISVRYYMWAMLFFIAVSAIVGIRKNITMTRSEYIFEMAFVGFAALAILEAVRYIGVNVLKMIDFPLLRDSILFYGLPVFLVFLVYSFIVLISETGDESIRESINEQKALKDYSKDVYTRFKLPELLRELENSESDFAIVRYKINETGTKEERIADINDFSNFLKRTYPQEKDIVLVDENEFVLVVHGDTEGIETKDTDNLKNIIKAMGSTLSYKMGVARSTDEKDIKPERVYELAGMRIN